nr:hypothetical protein [uncultured Novosphingobium sp.]
MWATLKESFIMATKFAESAEALGAINSPYHLNHLIGIDDHIASTHPVLANLKTWGEDTRKLAEGINVRRATANEEVTKAKNLSDVAKVADAACEKVSLGYSKQIADVAAGKSQAEAAVNAKIALTASPHAAEIRSVFLSMSPEDRSAAMATAFKDNDREVLAALVNAPAITHGCDRDQLAAHYEAYKRNVAFAEYRVLDEYNKAASILDKCQPDLLRWKADIYQGTKEHVAKQAQTAAIMKSYGFSVDED